MVAAQKIQREGFSSIAFNDDYFLIGTFDGELIKYDENKFYSLCKLKDNESVTKIEYYGNKYFLIGGERYLFLYKEGKFINLLNGYKILDIVCNKNKECLIYTVRIKDKTPKLFKYDGKKIANIDIGINTSPNSNIWIKEMQSDSNGSWLLIINNELFRYDSNSNNNKLKKVDVGISVSAIGWNGNYWLIAGYNKSKKREVKLILYGHNSTKEINFSSKFFKSPLGVSVAPKKIGWNNEYFLMDNGYSLIKYRYENKSFSAINYCKNIYSPFRIRGMLWSSKLRCWLILYDLAGTEGSVLAKYDGSKNISWLSYPLTSEVQWPPIGEVVLSSNEGYWLIDTFIYLHPEAKQLAEYKPAIIKYDGKHFVDLTLKFKEREKEERMLSHFDIWIIISLLILILFILWKVIKLF